MGTIYLLSTCYLPTIYPLSGPCGVLRAHAPQAAARCESTCDGTVRAAHRAVERRGVRELVVRRVRSELHEAHHLQQGTAPRCSRRAEESGLSSCVRLEAEAGQVRCIGAEYEDPWAQYRLSSVN